MDNINKIIGSILELYYLEKLTYDEAHDLALIVMESPKVGSTISAEEEAEINKILNMSDYTFFSGLELYSRSSDGYSAYDPTPYKEQLRNRKWIQDNAFKIWR